MESCPSSSATDKNHDVSPLSLLTKCTAHAQQGGNLQTEHALPEGDKGQAWQETSKAGGARA